MRRTGVWIVGWVLLAVGLFIVRGHFDPLTSEPASVLPISGELYQAQQLELRAFPQQSAQSQIVLIFHRSEGLSTSDQQFLQQIVEQLRQNSSGTRDSWRVMAAELEPTLRSRLYSRDGQAAMIVLNLQVNFITQRAMAAVLRAETLVRPQLPAGLMLEITGTAAIGMEHNLRSERAFHRTTWVTVLAVLLILLLVYRTPLGALVPLVAIGLSVFIALRVLDLLAGAGWPISNADRTFTVVLLFGAGTDYALFWIARYREELVAGRRYKYAALRAMQQVGPTIVGSALTTVAGLLMLMTADMNFINNAGRVLGIGLLIALAAAITLTPALVVGLGRAFFWPGSARSDFALGQRRWWPMIAQLVVHRPRQVLLGGLMLLAVPAVISVRMPIRYDSFGEVHEHTSAARGLALAKTHFSAESLFSTRLFLQLSPWRGDAAAARQISDQLVGVLEHVQGVSDVWHWGAPLGHNLTMPADRLLQPLADRAAANFYFSPAENVLQIEFMQPYPPLSREAVAVYQEARQQVEAWAEAHLPAGYQLAAVGQTPYILEVQRTVDADLVTVRLWVVVVIGGMVLLLIRQFGVSLFMLGSTLLTYAAALGLSHLTFVVLLGQPPIDYKIKVLVFVIIVAVGQDYNIFLMGRLLQERRAYGLREGVLRAVVLTGPVISSCGVIMAATLGSLMSTGVDLTQQLGFAFAVGILIDTFIVRPLLLPGFCLWWCRES
ncbi:MAG: hypothetical protein HJJLKODD_02050 [Phycisphaerae bacterium]|nr:hypothetical protein [Phycisphaerae bacterium]